MVIQLQHDLTSSYPSKICTTFLNPTYSSERTVYYHNLPVQYFYAPDLPKDSKKLLLTFPYPSYLQFRHDNPQISSYLIPLFSNYHYQECLAPFRKHPTHLVF